MKKSSVITLEQDDVISIIKEKYPNAHITLDLSVVDDEWGQRVSMECRVEEDA